MINNIITFGTSCTAGGGFEFDSLYPHRDKNGFKTKFSRGEFIKSMYIEQPYTQENYSYPGQLIKLLRENNHNIKVKNISKQGYGNERIYRKFYDLLIENELDINSTLFIFEFSDLSRKEFFHNPSKNHLIMNYLSDDTQSETIRCSLAKSYWYDKKADRRLYRNDVQLFSDYKHNFIEVDNELKQISMELLLFLEFLEYNNISFLISAVPEITHPIYEKELQKYYNKCILFGFPGGKKYNSFPQFATEEKLEIHHETSGAYIDQHGGLLANQLTSMIIYNELIKQNFINGKILQIPLYKDFRKNLKHSII